MRFEHELTTAEVIAVLEKQQRLPKDIFSGHGSQFKEQWKRCVAGIMLKRILLILLIRRTRARLNGAFGA